MTNLRKIILIPALIAVSISSFFSCGVDRWPEYAHMTALDTWMYDVMKQNYLWYEGLPLYDDVNLFLEPSAFLAKVKNSKDSYSFADSIMESPLPTYGFDYSLIRSVDIDTAYNALITYVIPGSPAEEAGLKRGDWIMKVDTSYISKKYETQLLQGTKSRDLVMGIWKEVIIEEEETPVYKVVPNDVTLSMGVARIVEDNPVHKYVVLPLSNGQKVGYLMYNSFTAGTKADPEKYNNELRKISNEFQQAGVQTVILDLRYNAGGSTDCVQLLGTILVPASRLDTPMAYLEYNDKNRDKDVTFNFDPSVLKTGVNLNQSLLIVITSGVTAGAPEMLITSLFKENDAPAIIAIGGSTKGQNVATEQFINEEFLWSVHPVVCTVYNSTHDTYGPISPAADFKISETTIDGKTNYNEYLPFGDPQERLLNIAIQTLEGNYPPKVEPEVPAPTGSFKIEKRVISPASRQFTGGGGLRIK